MIYLDNAATSWPKPEVVYQTMDKFLREKGGNAGHGSHSLALAALQTIDETRLLTARLINAPEIKRIIFTLSCTDSINLALKGVLQPGDQAIVSGLEHNAVMRPLEKLQRQGIDVVQLEIDPLTGFTNTRKLEGAITPQTRLIEMVHISNVNGVIQPISEYGEIALKHNLIFMVDAAQSVGHFPIDVVKDNIDLLAFSAHKGPLGAPGVGVLYIGPRVDPDTLREGGTGTSSESGRQPDQYPSKYESGTLNSVGIAGLGAGLKFIDQVGQKALLEHEVGLTNLLIKGLSEIPGISIYKAGDAAYQAPVFLFNIEQFEPAEIGAILDTAFDIKARTGLHCSPSAHRSIGTFPKGGVRLSPGYFNTKIEIEQTIDAIRSIASSKRSQP